MRTEMKVNFTCSECGSLLEIPSEQNKDAPEFEWAGNITFNIKVQPCPHCIKKKTEDARLLAESLKNLIK